MPKIRLPKIRRPKLPSPSDIGRQIGRATGHVVDATEHVGHAIEDGVRHVRDQGREEIDKASASIQHSTGIKIKPIIKSISGPAHILVKVAEGDNLSEATSDWVVNHVEAYGTLASPLGSDLEKVAQAIAAVNALPFLLLVNATGDAVEIVEGDAAPEEIVGTLLHTLIQHAHDTYERYAVPIPAVTRLALANLVAREVLDRARYVVDASPSNVAGLVNSLHRGSGGRRNAVTVDNIIVFSSPPSLEIDGLLHWIHELKHVEQYARWGLLKFAAEYTTDHSSVEREADAAEAEAQAKIGAV